MNLKTVLLKEKVAFVGISAKKVLNEENLCKFLTRSFVSIIRFGPHSI